MSQEGDSPQKLKTRGRIGPWIEHFDSISTYTPQLVKYRTYFPVSSCLTFVEYTSYSTSPTTVKTDKKTVVSKRNSCLRLVMCTRGISARVTRQHPTVPLEESALSGRGCAVCLILLGAAQVHPPRIMRPSALKENSRFFLMLLWETRS